MDECYWSEDRFLSFLVHYQRNTERGQREELELGLPVQYVNNISHGKNLGSAPGKAEPITQQFFKIAALQRGLLGGGEG